MEKPAEIFTCLGAGDRIYASEDNLYITLQRNEYFNKKSSISFFEDYSNYNEFVEIYKFKLSNGKAGFVARGVVPGNVHDQFSMDEYQDHFRIATTVGRANRKGRDTSYNNLYILDANMMQVGQIENIAPGERIYSVRFMGGRAYMVTFKTVDPLYVLDVSNPESPAILGELKIPGYSDYLHPYDENHIIGFGKDTIELESSWDPDIKWAYYKGLKVALFDVTDVGNPELKYSLNIGDRGTGSELLSNHKALLFSKEKELLAFPVNLMECRQTFNDEKNSDLSYGEPSFQGLYVYNLNKDSGFAFKGRITHFNTPDIWNSNLFVSRGVYIGNVLYTISNNMLKANDLNSMEEIRSLELNSK